MMYRLQLAGIVTLNGDFAGANMPGLSVAGLDFWMSEFYCGHTESLWTNRRQRYVTSIVQYNLYVPQGSGTDTLDEKSNAIELCFNVADERADIKGDGVEARVYKIKVDTDRIESQWCVRPVVIYLKCAVNIL